MFIIISLVTLCFHKSSILVLAIILIVFIYSLIEEKFKEYMNSMYNDYFISIMMIILEKISDIPSSVTSELTFI